jgi:hypothetical protein
MIEEFKVRSSSGIRAEFRFTFLVQLSYYLISQYVESSQRKRDKRTEKGLGFHVLALKMRMSGNFVHP